MPEEFTQRKLERALLRELTPYYEDPDYEEIAICQPQQLFVKLRQAEDDGEGGIILWKELRAPKLTQRYLTRVIQGISNIYGKHYHPKKNPVCFTQIHNRHRLAAATGPAIIYDEVRPEGGICISIRQSAKAPNPAWRDTLAHYGVTGKDKVSRDRRLLSPKEERKQAEAVIRRAQQDYILDSLDADPEMEKNILKAARDGIPILISGPMSSGKTTLLNQLVMHVNLNNRVVSIEDTGEIIIPHRNRVQIMIPRDEGEEQDAGDTLSPKQAINLITRLTPEVIMTGEISMSNGYMAYTLMNMGHQHFWTTIHAKSVEQAHRTFAERIQTSWPSRNAPKAEQLQDHIGKKMMTIQTLLVGRHQRRIVEARMPSSWKGGGS